MEAMMISLNRVGVEKLQRRFPKIEEKFDEDVMAFIISLMDQTSRPWMWKKHEIYQAGGEMAYRGWCKLMALYLADHWVIDDVYVIAPELYILDFGSLAMKAFDYRIKATSDGGWWLYRGYHQIDYYRRKGMAKRRALKEIHKRIEEGRR